ncbi:AAA family ATPase [Deinococcus taeanensis]|uniref:AAA family ATPase n=1 Tax=Deinococcus taeanensis TaxID=2737050 RepID=UPI001CDC5821|nr:AAA family ATPase [Deinococcus taeanensis]UBV43514.1 AAA family ATPase [Deinococcus taeanensis]
MSGTGKTTTLRELARRGHRTVDTDDEWNEWRTAPDGPDWVWREDRIQALLDTAGPAPLILSGCHSNQGLFHRQFQAVVPLSAPLPVLLTRVQASITTSHRRPRPHRGPRQLGRAAAAPHRDHRTEHRHPGASAGGRPDRGAVLPAGALSGLRWSGLACML